MKDIILRVPKSTVAMTVTVLIDSGDTYQMKVRSCSTESIKDGSVVDIKGDE